MRRRYVETPTGDRWVVERRWLLGPPGWRGFRFGLRRRRDRIEPPVVVRREDDEGAGHYRRTGTGTAVDVATDALWWGGWPGGWGGGGDAAAEASGAVAREASAAVARGGSGSVARAGGGGGDDGGLFDFDLDVGIGPVLAVIAVIAVAAIAVVFVLPALVFAVELLVFGLVVGISAGWRAMTGRPWIVEAREDRPAPRGIAWEVRGWRSSTATMDDVVADLQRGERPDPTDTPQVDEVRVIDAG